METPKQKRKRRSEVFAEGNEKKQRFRAPGGRKIDLNERLKIARDYKANPTMSQAEMARKWKISTDQARHIVLTAEQLIRIVQVTDCPKGFRRVNSSRRHLVLDLAEPRLAYWIAEQNSKGFPISQKQVNEKIFSLCEIICRQVTELDSAHVLRTFQASNGWFCNFRQRFDIEKIRYKMSGVGVVRYGAHDFQCYEDQHSKLKQELQEYQLCQVYSGDETSLNWKLFPDKKQTKRRYCALFLVSNATGDHRLKPYMLYTSCQPKHFPHLEVAQMDYQLPAIYAHQINSQMDLTRFGAYIKYYFIPTVIRYQTECGIPPDKQKAVLLVDSSPAHRKLIAEEPALVDGSGFLKLIIIQPGMLSLLQPNNQTVYTPFKSSYLFNLLRLAKSKGPDKRPLPAAALYEFSRNLTIREAIDLIGETWSQLPVEILTTSWDRLLHSKSDGFHRIPIDPKLQSLASEFGVSVEWFLTEPEDVDLTDIITLAKSEVREIRHMVEYVQEAQKGSDSNRELNSNSMNDLNQDPNSTNNSNLNSKSKNSSNSKNSTPNNNNNNSNQNSNLTNNQNLSLTNQSSTNFLPINYSNMTQNGTSNPNIVFIIPSLPVILPSVPTSQQPEGQIAQQHQNVINPGQFLHSVSINDQNETQPEVESESRVKLSKPKVNKTYEKEVITISDDEDDKNIEQAKAKSFDLLKKLFEVSNDLAMWQRVNQFLEQNIDDALIEVSLS